MENNSLNYIYIKNHEVNIITVLYNIVKENVIVKTEHFDLL